MQVGKEKPRQADAGVPERDLLDGRIASTPKEFTAHSQAQLSVGQPSSVGVRRALGHAPSPLSPRMRGAIRSRIDFSRVNETAVDVLPAILRRWLPGGRIVGCEYVALNPTRNDKRIGSFKVAVSGYRAGRWADFATGDRGGDPVSLAAYLFGISQSQAARLIAEMLGVSRGR